jgi:hypothetical protein
MGSDNQAHTGATRRELQLWTIEERAACASLWMGHLLIRRCVQLTS